MRGLKTLVIVMGVMLVGGFAALVATIAYRSGHRAAPPGAPFSATPVAIPAGARVEAIGGGAERIIVALTLADGTRELLVIDPATGQRLGTIPLREDK